MAKIYKTALKPLENLGNNLKGLGEIASNKVKTYNNNRNSIKNIKKLSDVQGERNFMRNNPTLADKSGNFPKAGEGMPNSYNKKASDSYNNALNSNLDKFGFGKRKK